MARIIILTLLLLCVALALCDGYSIKKSSGKSKFKLKVGQGTLLPEGSPKKGKKEVNKEPTSDVIPQEAEYGETTDNQTHFNNREVGMPPKYPLNSQSAENTAHDNEIGGCRDHPRAAPICALCGNKCFASEHESYTYSYCRRSCKHCDAPTTAFHTFWRLRAASEFQPTWMLKELEFYANPEENITLVDDPQRAFASSSYAGFNASYAFDENMNTAWYPSGWGEHDNNDDWIAYEFAIAVRIHAVKMTLDESHQTAAPKKIFVEASDKKFGPYVKKWTIHNPTSAVSNMYRFLECPVLWRRYDYDNGAWCFRLIAKFVTWENAKQTCDIEGGELATILDKDEQRFVVDEIRPCGYTWIGLSRVNRAYYWNDGTNSSYRSWKSGVTYSDVQQDNLNCVTMDSVGDWETFQCSDKFYFLCKRKLMSREPPDENKVLKPWPYDPEIPPVIFMAPNVTVPVINSRNLEPGQFPDANGNVEEVEDEEKTIKDILYEQTVEHLKEKGLKPSEEIMNDEEEEETDYTKQLNKIAVEAKNDDYKNETKADEAKDGTVQSHKEEQKMKKKEEEDVETDNSANNKPIDSQNKNGGGPVPGPPSSQPTGQQQSTNDELPKIVNGEPVNDNSSKSSTHTDSNQSSGGTNQSGQSGVGETGGSSNVSNTNTGNNNQQGLKENENGGQNNQNSNSQSGNQGNNNINNNNIQGSSNNGQQPSVDAPQPQQPNNNGRLSNSNGQQSSSNSQQSSSNGQQSSNNGQQSSSNGQQSISNGQQSSSNGQQSSNNGQQSSNNGQQSSNNGQQSSSNGQHSSSNGQQSSSNGQQSSSNNSKGSSGDKTTHTTNDLQNSDGNVKNKNGPSVTGGSLPKKVPEPPPTKEGDKDNDKQDSVGGQSDENPDDESDSNESNNSNEKDENESDDEDDENKGADEDEKDDSEKIPEKPNQKKPTQGKEILEDKDITNGGQKDSNNNNQSNFIKAKKKYQKKGKTATQHVQKKSKPSKLKKRLGKYAPKRTKVAKADTGNGSGSGDQGDDVELDNIFDSITNDLW